MARETNEQIRKKLLSIHGDRCWICGARMPEGDRTIDHVYPKWMIRCDALWNLRLAHDLCNNQRSNGHVGLKFRARFERRWRRIRGD